MATPLAGSARRAEAAAAAAVAAAAGSGQERAPPTRARPRPAPSGPPLPRPLRGSLGPRAGPRSAAAGQRGRGFHHAAERPGKAPERESWPETPHSEGFLPAKCREKRGPPSRRAGLSEAVVLGELDLASSLELSILSGPLPNIPTVPPTRVFARLCSSLSPQSLIDHFVLPWPLAMLTGLSIFVHNYIISLGLTCTTFSTVCFVYVFVYYRRSGGRHLLYFSGSF